MRAGAEITLTELAATVSSRIPAQGRYLLGIAGPPAAGKSTLSRQLVAAVRAEQTVPAQIAPMDGFHRTSAELDAAGARHRKGEPDTFDTAGFVARLRRLRTAPLGRPVPWPDFDRARDDPVPDAIVFTGQRLAVVEGNYLLLEQPGWAQVRAQLDEVWYLHAEQEVIEPRLVDRHRHGGMTIHQARVKVADSDLPNARLIAGTRAAADLVLREDGGSYAVLEQRR